MADETVVTTNTADATGQETVNSGDGGQEQQATAITFASEVEFKAKVESMLKERLDRERRKTDEATAKARTEAERKAAEESGQFKQLAESLKAELEAERQRAKALELSALKRAAAEKVGLPAALADRLMGDDAEALEADARAVLAALPKPAAPNINAASGGGNGAQLIGGMTEDMLREQATRLGVNPEYYRKQFIRS